MATKEPTVKDMIFLLSNRSTSVSCSLLKICKYWKRKCRCRPAALPDITMISSSYSSNGTKTPMSVGELQIENTSLQAQLTNQEEASNQQMAIASSASFPEVYNSLASASLLYGFSKLRMTFQSFLSAGSMFWDFYGVVHILCTILHACRQVNITICQIKSCSGWVCCIALANYCNETIMNGVMTWSKFEQFLCKVATAHAIL